MRQIMQRWSIHFAQWILHGWKERKKTWKHPLSKSWWCLFQLSINHAALIQVVAMSTRLFWSKIFLFGWPMPDVWINNARKRKTINCPPGILCLWIYSSVVASQPSDAPPSLANWPQKANTHTLLSWLLLNCYKLYTCGWKKFCNDLGKLV